MFKLTYYFFLATLVNIILIFSSLIQYEYYLVLNLCIFWFYTRKNKIIFVKSEKKLTTNVSNKYYLCIQRMVFCVLFFIAGIVSYLESEKILLFISVLFVIYHIYLVKINWIIMKNHKEDLGYLSTK